MWREFFSAHAPFYDQNAFTQNTVAEVDFFVGLFALPVGARVLDVGCGTGRHAVELAKRGYEVTGIDLTPAMLEIAQRKAAEAGVSVRFVEMDATRLQLGETFDAAICLCEGAVGLIEVGEDAEAHDAAIFSGIAEHLKPGSPFLLTALNGYSIIRQMKDEHVADGRFNPATMVANYDDQMDLPEGPKVVRIYERLFLPPEMARLLREAGFRVSAIWGGTAGHWGQRHLSLDEIEAMYVCVRDQPTNL